MKEFRPEGWLIDTAENRAALRSQAALGEAMRLHQLLEARAAVCDSAHNLIVDLGCMKGIIPREEGALGVAEGAVKDIAMISRVNKPVSFFVTGFTSVNGRPYATLSRRMAQEECRREYLSTLRPGDIIDARITHLEHKELLGTWEENASLFAPGETVAGVVRSVEDYGIFVELTPNLAGLAEPKENVLPGQQASVYIKSLLPEKMKIKLIIIDTFQYDYSPAAPEYYFTGSHMDRFIYSPECSPRKIETVFDVLPEGGVLQSR